MRTRKHLAIAAAMVGLVAPVQAEFYPGSTDFEGDTPLADVCWSNVVEATVVVDTSVADANRSPNLPPSFDTTSRTNVLSFDTDAPIVRYLQSDRTAPSASTIYADILLKWQPCPAGSSAPEAGDDDKILVYTRVSQSGSETNLCVYAKDAADGTAQEFVLTKTVGKDEWHRLVVKATAAGYQVYCDGAAAADLCKTADDVDTFYALSSGAPLTSVAFAGAGHVDDLVLSDFDPALPIYTLTWGEGFDSVSFTTNGVAGAALAAADGEYRFQAPEGLEVVLTGNTGYRTIEVSVTGSSSAISLEGVSGIAKYFPQTATAGQDGSAEHPFELADADDLQVLKAAFAADASCRSLNYKVVADIDATDLGYWDGIGAQGTANSGLNGGTLDGDGHTISNLMFSTGTYRAFFNRMDNATIKNLTIHVKDIQETDAEEHGYAAFVGNLQNSVLQNCVATGTIGTVAKPSMHISAGFAATVGSGGVFLNCTNLISIVCAQTANPKIGGIVGLMQGGALTNCWNDGDITIAVKGSNDADNGAGGLIGYAQSNSATIYHCGNAGTVQSTSDFASHANNIPINVGTIIGRQKSSATTVAGDTIAQADAAPAGARSNVGGAVGIFFGLIYGLDFAIVDDNVATFVSSLAAGNTYKVMLSGATATYNFTEPGTIAFDEAMYTPTYVVTAADGLALTDATAGTVKTYTAAAVPATWVGGPSGDWETASNWDGGFVPTMDTVVTFTNDAQVAILGSDRCKEMVLSNAKVALVRDANATKPVLHFYGNEGRAVSVASGAKGSLGVNNLALFTESMDGNNNLTIDCAFAVLGDVTFRGITIRDRLAASFTITGKTTVSADATVKTIDWGTTKFQGGIEVAKGVTAKILTRPNGRAQIGTGVTLVANDGEGNPTTIWLMNGSNWSRKVSLDTGASVAVDAKHAATYFVAIEANSASVPDEHGLNPAYCDVYTAARNPTVFVTTYGVTVAGVENGQRVTPGTNLVISISGFAEGYEPFVTIMKHEDYSELLTTNVVSFTYTMPDFDINVVADATPPSYNDPEGREIEDLALVEWLSANNFTQSDIDALGNDAAATDKLYECWLLNCSIKAANPGGTISATGIAVTNGVISITVQLARQSPLGFIRGVVHIYGTDDLTDDFSLISDEIVGFGEGDPIFDTAPAEGAVTQSVTATFSPADVTAKFFKAVIEFPIPEDPEEPWEEPEPDPEE